MNSLVDKLGVVVIGRNESKNLFNCLEAVIKLGCPVVYADSNSSDGSPEMAARLGVTVIRLDHSSPFTASRGRKEGCDYLAMHWPKLDYVLFTDGDCIINDEFVLNALSIMSLAAEIGVVCGGLTERNPTASLYNRIAALEWESPAGLVNSCGGNALMRLRAYALAGGYDASIQAGEEPELCSRIRRSGFKVMRIEASMGSHDLDMHLISQWWCRGIRTGFGALDVRMRFGIHHFDRILISAWVWVLGWPILNVALVVAASVWLGGCGAFGTSLLMLLILLIQVVRIAHSARARGLSSIDALAYGFLMMANKWSCAWGQLKWWRQVHTPLRKASADSFWKQDLLRYPKRPFLKEQSIWAIAIHRWGSSLHARPNGVYKQVIFQMYWLIFRLVETLTGISLPHNAKIGPGLRIHHFGGIFVNPQTVMGANCTLRQGVTLGNRYEGGGAPAIGSNVEFGAYAQVLGNVSIGDNARVGAMSVVLDDVPANCTVVGNPARVIRGGIPSNTPLECKL